MVVIIMSSKQLDKIYTQSKRLQITSNDRIVIMSDCHRGTGDKFDNFLKNKNIYLGALRHYYYRGFYYIELGDGDDMWEVKRYQDIIEENLSVFKMLKKFKDDNHLIMIYGNHDIIKRYPSILKKYFYTYFDNLLGEKRDLLNDMTVYESIVLEYKDKELFLLHGHQVDFFNSKLWLLSRFFVRNVWRKLEAFGIKDPTNAAKKYSVSKNVEKKLQKYSNEKNKLLIAGHTHRPIMPQIKESLYFNDGSCIHPNGITCLEIEDGCITLVKWEYSINKKKNINIKRVILGNPTPIDLYFQEN